MRGVQAVRTVSEIACPILQFVAGPGEQRRENRARKQRSKKPDKGSLIHSDPPQRTIEALRTRQFYTFLPVRGRLDRLGKATSGHRRSRDSRDDTHLATAMHSIRLADHESD